MRIVRNTDKVPGQPHVVTQTLLPKETRLEHFQVVFGLVGWLVGFL